MLPVGEPWHDDAIQVAENCVEGLRAVRRRRRQRCLDLAWSGDRHHRAIADARTVVGDEVNDVVTVFTELVGRHRWSRKDYAEGISADYTDYADLFSLRKD